MGTPLERDADRGGDHAIDAVRAAVGEDAAALPRIGEPFDVANRHRRRHHERTVLGQARHRGAGDGGFGRRVRRLAALRRWHRGLRHRPRPSDRATPAGCGSIVEQGGQLEGRDRRIGFDDVRRLAGGIEPPAVFVDDDLARAGGSTP